LYNSLAQREIDYKWRILYDMMNKTSLCLAPDRKIRRILAQWSITATVMMVVMVKKS
jgi:hypothetical protein